jgi:formamidopyrimidine-DNA glycosylase
MPELPEVETIARGLASVVRGRTVMDATVLTPGPVPDSEEGLSRRVAGRAVLAVRRRAKLLIMDLAGDLHLVFHLKMTGRVWVTHPEAVPCRHVHVIFLLDNGDRIFFEDQRRFGYCRLFSGEELKAWPFFADLGPEPLEIGPEEFASRFTRRSARIKSLLLDQGVIAGIGNIYADESLYRTGIHPRTKASDIPEARLRELHHNLQAVLREAIDAGGSSFRDYRDAYGQPGQFQERFSVYGRKGEPCERCGTSLGTEKVAGRTSTFCRKCQPAPGK